ncbi:Protein WEAK CHLOROPLAST MOVEMENT UNDER BLUE LIGHT 1 [Platanthera guangdongensis]|uniref:Protein WEAK CHLOROPLAST MOVEMENT UNDER BLUE LIGHT 1 n=1 Tax=Platanthera guangdongensis TaxID=2320717 RepID=A0ABR2MZ07_9ASPA
MRKGKLNKMASSSLDGRQSSTHELDDHGKQSLEGAWQARLEKVEQEIPLYQKHLEAAEDAKDRVLQELEITKSQVEEIKLQLEKALTEETRALQNSEWPNSVSRRSSTELETRTARQAKHRMREIDERRDAAAKKAEEAAVASEDVEKRVDELTIELAIAKETLESAHSSHLNAEEQGLDAAVEREQGNQCLQQKLKQSEEELHSFEEKLAAVNDVELKLDTASSFLNSLKGKLVAYVETEIGRDEKHALFSQTLYPRQKRSLRKRGAAWRRLRTR